MFINKIKKALLLIFIFIVVLVTAASIYYIAVPVNTQELSYQTVKKSMKTNTAYIVRDEEILFADTAGTIYNNVRDGERISAQTLIATIYNANVSAATLKSLRTIDNKIEEQLQSDGEFNDLRFDRTDTESKVAAIVEDIPNVVRRNDVLRIAEYRQMINDIRQGNETGEENVLEDLHAQKAELEEKIHSTKSEIKAPQAGVFTTYTDGLEGFLKDEDITTYTVEYLKSLPATQNDRITNIDVTDGDAIGKIVNNHVWYLVMSAPSKSMADHEKGESVTLMLDTLGEKDIKGTIYHIGEVEEDQTQCVVIKCSTYIEGAFSYRASKAELIFESYSGYKVPIHSIHSDANGDRYVKCRVGARECACYCTVEYTNVDEEYIIINSAPYAQNKLENMERIIVGEK